MIILTSQVSGLILAGGRGRRVSQQDKGLLNFQGSRLVERQIEWFSNQVESVMISANRNLDHYQSYGLKVISDPSTDFPGPLAGVAKALQYSPTKWLFVQPVDMPLMPNDVIHRLCMAVKTDRSAYYLVSQERKHFLSLLISTGSLPLLTDYLAGGGKRVSDFLKLIDAKAIDLGLSEMCFTNLNQISDFCGAELSSINEK